MFRFPVTCKFQWFVLLITACLFPLALAAHGMMLQSSDSASAAASSDQPGQAVSETQDDIRALKRFTVMAGTWRGVGQVQRGSSNGSWVEKGNCAWMFQNGQGSLTMNSDSMRLFRSLQLKARSTPSDLPDQLQMIVTWPDEKTNVLVRSDEQSNEQVSVFVSMPDQTPGYRCIVRQISEIRMAILLEQRTTATGSFRRMAEVGYTREGEKLANANSGERQCVVTGGLGRIAVVWEGRTWYVCCDGCRQVFEDDPAATIAAWKERQQAERQQKGSDPQK